MDVHDFATRYRAAMRQAGRPSCDDLPDQVIADRQQSFADGLGISLEQLLEALEAATATLAN